MLYNMPTIKANLFFFVNLPKKYVIKLESSIKAMYSGWFIEPTV